MMPSNVYMSASDFFQTVQPDEKVYFLVRHGERGHILPDDPDHGAFVGLTDKGRQQAFNLGKAIGSALLTNLPKVAEPAEVCFFSSPVGRCMETAQNIARGMGVEASVTPCQPLAEFFVEHYDAYMETHKTGFYQGICRWLDGYASDPNYVDPAYYNLAWGSNEMRKLMLDLGSARVNIFCSHDAWIVPCLAYFCGLKYTPQLWMNFLSGMALVVGPRGERFVPVTGLEDGNLYF